MSAIAIDGPAGAGKSTVARGVAARLGLVYLDTGALYRVVALAALRRGLPVSDGAGIADLARSSAIEASGEGATLDGEDVTADIRGPLVTAAVSAVAAHPEVRAVFLDLQRAAAASQSVVMEGRDIGTVVLPDADLKVFLTADLDERARRRSRESGVDDAEVARQMAERDHMDSTRAVAPLVKAPDAVEIDTTGMSIDEVVQAIVDLATTRGIGAPGG